MFLVVPMLEERLIPPVLVTAASVVILVSLEGFASVPLPEVVPLFRLIVPVEVPRVKPLGTVEREIAFVLPLVGPTFPKPRSIFPLSMYPAFEMPPLPRRM